MNPPVVKCSKWMRVLVRSPLSSSSGVHWSVCQCYLIWQIESLEKHSCQLFADNLSIKLHRVGHWYTVPGVNCAKYDGWNCCPVTWTSCISSCLASRIIFTWKDLMVVQQPMLKHSTSCNMYLQLTVGRLSVPYLQTSRLYLLTVVWALTACPLYRHHQPDEKSSRWEEKLADNWEGGHTRGY